MFRNVTKKTNNTNMKMGFSGQRNIIGSNNIVRSLSQIVNNNQEPVREMLWAQPTWTLLHTLAQKVNEERFSEIRLELLNIIYTIVTLLPCPICAEHGKKFLDGVNFNTIVTKENLKYLLFDFHNLVNHSKHLPTFYYPDLIKYQNTNTNNVIRNFMFFFSKKSGTIRLIADDLHRKGINEGLKKWFNDNIQFFSP